jgi:hypothetical protein
VSAFRGHQRLICVVDFVGGRPKTGVVGKYKIDYSDVMKPNTNSSKKRTTTTSPPTSDPALIAANCAG